jgi:hypothetical protein
MVAEGSRDKSAWPNLVVTETEFKEQQVRSFPTEQNSPLLGFLMARCKDLSW